MNASEILQQQTTKTAKIQMLLALGLSRKEVASLMGVGYGFVQNVYAKAYPERVRNRVVREVNPTFYQRRLTDIAGDDHENYSAWVYFLARADERLASMPPVSVYERDAVVVS